MIPNSVLNGAIRTAAKVSERLYELVRTGMLTGKYNLNHKVNIIILPMQKVVANGMGLPRHLAGKKPEPGQKVEVANHAKYNDKVRTKVNNIIATYANKVDQKEHDAELPEFNKEQLVKYSGKLYTGLTTWGKVARGQAVNMMPASYFR